jgi:hypothetical protein
MLSTSNSSTPSSFLPLEMLGGLTFCCWIIHSGYFKNHRKEYLSVWDIWRLKFRDLNLETEMESWWFWNPMATVCQYICDIIEIIVSSSGVGPSLFEVQESSFVGLFVLKKAGSFW